MWIYETGYDGKLTAKNWAKLSKKSLDTALRDIADLVERGVLKAKEGGVRNVEYEVNFDEKNFAELI